MDEEQQLAGQNFEWRVASSCSGGQCVRVAFTDGMVALGDTKNPGAHQLYSHAEWSGFIAAVKAGRFDLA